MSCLFFFNLLFFHSECTSVLLTLSLFSSFSSFIHLISPELASKHSLDNSFACLLLSTKSSECCHKSHLFVVAKWPTFAYRVYSLTSVCHFDRCHLNCFSFVSFVFFVFFVSLLSSLSFTSRSFSEHSFCFRVFCGSITFSTNQPDWTLKFNLSLRTFRKLNDFQALCKPHFVSFHHEFHRFFSNISHKLCSQFLFLIPWLSVTCEYLKLSVCYTGNGCQDTLGDYNPYHVEHGSPMHKIRHLGDLGNIEANSTGVARFKFVDKQLRVQDRIRGVIGRSIVVSKRRKKVCFCSLKLVLTSQIHTPFVKCVPSLA